MANFLGVDCGATTLRVGIVDQNGILQSQKQLPSPLKNQPEKLAEMVKDQIRGERVDGIGVGVPGPLDLEKGLLLPSSNLANITPIPITHFFEVVFNTKIHLDRDTNVALLGEAWKGAAVGLNNVVMLTLGSGVGGAILDQGQLEHGETSKAGELGHMYIEIPDLLTKVDLEILPKCGLGHQGCLEALINSSKNIDELSIYLGYGLANIVDIFNPELILIGGGKLFLGDFLPKAIAIMKTVGMKPAVDEVRVEYAKLKEWSGVYGAAKLGMNV